MTASPAYRSGATHDRRGIRLDLGLLVVGHGVVLLRQLNEQPSEPVMGAIPALGPASEGRGAGARFSGMGAPAFPRIHLGAWVVT